MILGKDIPKYNYFGATMNIGTEPLEGMLYYNKKHDALYLCQNKKDGGNMYADKRKEFGFKYAWYLGNLQYTEYDIIILPIIY